MRIGRSENDEMTQVMPHRGVIKAAQQQGHPAQPGHGVTP
jgi:hypothetical protein